VRQASAACAEADADAEFASLPEAVRSRDNLTGRYELFAVITHEGRTAEGGHYVAWIKDDAANAAAAAAAAAAGPKGGAAAAGAAAAGGSGSGANGAAASQQPQREPGWLVFDDETVARVPADQIKKLHGGGDYHMAYMCFYRASAAIVEDIKENALRSASLPALAGGAAAAVPPK
jgi:ubiquitin carboxyl-terminal hydrolase 14